jgi:hypothetical protein
MKFDTNRIMPNYYDFKMGTPNMNYQKYPLMKDQINLVQQQEPKTSDNKMLKNRRRYITNSNHGNLHIID